MKKLFLAVIFAAFFAYCHADYSSTNFKLEIASDEWVKASDGAWPGKDNIWYKLDAKAKLWWSKDGKKWEASKDQTWQDKDGKWLKIGEGKLWWTADGKSWSEVPEWKWQGTDGKWYKFDKDWTVWVNK